MEGLWEQLKGYSSKQKCSRLTPSLRDLRAIGHPLPGSGMQCRELFPLSHGNPTPSPEMCGLLPTPSKGVGQAVNWPSLGGNPAGRSISAHRMLWGGRASPLPHPLGTRSLEVPSRVGSIPTVFRLGLEELLLLQDCVCSRSVSAG